MKRPWSLICSWIRAWLLQELDSLFEKNKLILTWFWKSNVQICTGKTLNESLMYIAKILPTNNLCYFNQQCYIYVPTIHIRYTTDGIMTDTRDLEWALCVCQYLIRSVLFRIIVTWARKEEQWQEMWIETSGRWIFCSEIKRNEIIPRI